MAPGNNETGGKQRSAKTRQGNRYLRRILVLAARGAARTKKTYLKSLYYRLKSRRGARKAAMAIGRTILQMAYHMIGRGEAYRELGDNYFDQFDKTRTAKRLIRRLEAMGFIVDIAERPLAQPTTEASHFASSLLPVVT
jgi:transposase